MDSSLQENHEVLPITENKASMHRYSEASFDKKSMNCKNERCFEKTTNIYASLERAWLENTESRNIYAQLDSLSKQNSL